MTDMPTRRQREQLASIRNLDELIDYLRDELGWPISHESFQNVDDLFYEFTPEELGIDSKNAAKIESIKRLRPLSVEQPWGIFFVEFEPRRLPVVALRRLLSAVALKKRASANPADRQAWAADDLLFVSNFGEDEERRISFAHFTPGERASDLPTLKVLGWDGLDTALRLDRVANTLHERLSWPEDQSDLEAWREQWRKAFRLRPRETITEAKELSIRLAELARGIRDRIKEVLDVESKQGPLRTLLEAFRKSLVADLDDKGFADMYAQTIAYGLLSARIVDPEHRTAEDFAAHMRTSPFLRELMESFISLGGRKKTEGGAAIDFDELGVSEVVELLDHAKMEDVVADFGRRKQGEDPVIHFYEDFLTEYDKKEKISRGVFYTPKPVVSYIVRSVDELLRTEFGLEDGLADTTTWSEMAERNEGLEIPDGADAGDPFVCILDPATGTGTFLVEVIEVIHATMLAKWKTEGMRAEKGLLDCWNEYVPKHLLPRLHGYELMMAPYAIAHLKIGLKLIETGYRFESEERARVYLTNALEPATDKQLTLDFLPALAHEAQVVNEIKRDQRFTVVVGNPPYSVSSWNTGKWITDLAEDYKKTVRAEESQIQALSNDYIKFLRLGEREIERAETGILGLITGHGYLSGTQPRDLRNHLSSSFDRCYCLDLHGSLRKARVHGADDEPVFEIMTGVAIFVGFRSKPHQERATMFLESLTGLLEAKFAFLNAQTASKTSLGGEPHVPHAPNYFFAAAATSQDIGEEYERWPDLPAMFGTGNRQADKEVYWATGFASQQDELAMSFTRKELDYKMADLASSRSFEELRELYRLCTTNQWDYSKAKDFAKRGLWKQYIGQVAYRPFDRQWTILHKRVLTILRKQVMSKLSGTKQNLGLISSRAVNDVRFAHCFVTDEPVDKIFISSKTSTNAYVFPLFFGANDLLGEKSRPNLSRTFLRLLGQSLGVGNYTENGLPVGLSPENIFHYAYAVLHSPDYRSRYAEFLKIDFPHLPLTGRLKLFRLLAKLGGELVGLHLLKSPALDKPISTYTGSKNPEVARVGWSDSTVWLDAGKTNAREGHRATKPGTVGFEGVPEEVWDFHIGGYQVCHKWLKDRKGRMLSDDDIAHYQKIVVALSETIRIMGEIDEVIEQHGGWPGAFQTGEAEQGDELLPKAAEQRGDYEKGC